MGYKPDECQSTVEYIPPILSPITDNPTKQELLKRSQKVIKEVGQNHVILTFDLAVAEKAYSFVWSQPGEFSSVIVRLGGFHLLSSYLGAMGKYL